MQRIRQLSVTFDQPLPAHLLPAFRGAVVEKVGVEHDIYHNHNNDPGNRSPYFYRYPLVQYKQRRRKPTIVFLQDGVEAAQYFFKQPDWDLQFAGRSYQSTIDKMVAKQYKLGVTEQEYHYTLRDWMALNQENFQRYQELESVVGEIRFLERVLVGHILGFASGVGVRFEERFELAITRVLGSRFVPFEGVRVQTFSLRFKTNLLLPPLVGLGKGVSRGFGVLHPYRMPSPAKSAAVGF